MIKQAWLESGCVYGCRKIHREIQDYGERCGINRVHKLMRNNSIKAQVGYRKPRHRSGEVHVVTSNTLAREFNPAQPSPAQPSQINLGSQIQLIFARTRAGFILASLSTYIRAK